MLVYALPRSAQAVAHRATARHFTRAIERLFDDAPVTAATRTPAMDVAETDTSFTVKLDVPGVTREQLKVTIEGRRLSVETIAAPEAAPADAAADAAPAKDAERSLYRERGSASYARTVSLPAEVDQAASQAKVENGVLTLTLVKKVPTGALAISIN